MRAPRLRSAFLSPVSTPSSFRSTIKLTPSSPALSPATSKSKELRFGWDGTTALGGAEVDSKPARLLDDIKASGETLHPDAELFLQNYEMDPKGFKFEEVRKL